MPSSNSALRARSNGRVARPCALRPRGPRPCRSSPCTGGRRRSVLQVAGRLVGAGEPGADHHVGRAGGQRQGDVARVADAAVGPDVPAEPAGLGGALQHGGELRAAHAGHHPGGAHRAGADADLDDVGAGLDQVAHAGGGDDVARRRPARRGSSARTARSALDHLLLVAVRGVDDEARRRRRRAAASALPATSPLMPTAAATRSRPSASTAGW